jgi:hypothetical protein
MIILVIIPGLQSIHLNKQKDLLFAVESMYPGEAYEHDPCLELVMISPGMFPHMLKSVGTYALFNTVKLKYILLQQKYITPSTDFIKRALRSIYNNGLLIAGSLLFQKLLNTL